jgi:hypothetical protein
MPGRTGARAKWRSGWLVRQIETDHPDIPGLLSELCSGKFIRQVALTVDGAVGAVFQENHFDLAPGQKRKVRVLDAAGGTRILVKGLNAPPRRRGMDDGRAGMLTQ